MPKNIGDDLITDREIQFAHGVMSGTMTDREAAEAAGLNPDTAAHTKAKPCVRAYMEEHRAKVAARLVDLEVEALRQRNLGRDRTLARLWELADLSPEATRGSIAGQVKAMAMIVAIEGLIPDRRQPQTQSHSTTSLPKPQIYVADWLRKQRECEAQGPEPADVVAGSEAQPATTEALDPEPSHQQATNTSSPDPDQNQSSTMNRETGSSVPDAANGTIFDANDPRAPLWMRMKRRRR
jgi:hypothetical protein